jgi:hypothetical protein
MTEAPVWKPGYEWAYRYESPAGNGTFVWSVDREEALDGVPHYVIKSGAREIFYRKSDLALSRETVDGVVVLKNTPARFYYVVADAGWADLGTNHSRGAAEGSSDDRAHRHGYGGS